MVSRGILYNTTSDISKFTEISQAAAVASDIWGVLKYHEQFLHVSISNLALVPWGMGFLICHYFKTIIMLYICVCFL